MNNIIALLKREAWEHQSFWIVPAVFASLLVLMQVLVLIALDRVDVSPMQWTAELIMRFAELETGERRALIKSLTLGMAVPFNVFLVGIMFFYSLGSLYDDRRDRSILFWKSLPISDVETVVSKLLAVALMAPAMTLGVVVCFHLVSLVLSTVVAIFVGGHGWYLAWDPVALASSWTTLAWGLLVQSLVYLPLIAWVMLASAWAKRAPFLWAVAPPVAYIIIEAIYTGRTRLGAWLVERGSEALPLAFSITANSQHYLGYGGMPDNTVDVSFAVLGRGLLWSGLAIAAVLLAGAVWLRRYRAEAE